MSEVFENGYKPESVLDFLVSEYLAEHPVSSEEIRRIEKKMGPYYEGISFEASSELFGLVYKLCGQYESAAFREGLLTGLQLAGEINGNG